jgi:hypothetical protein
MSTVSHLDLLVLLSLSGPDFVNHPLMPLIVVLESQPLIPALFVSPPVNQPLIPALLVSPPVNRPLNRENASVNQHIVQIRPNLLDRPKSRE